MNKTTEMDIKIKEYFEEINIANKMYERIYDIFIFYANNLCPEPIEDAFITDYISEELREYENLWFFSKNYAMEATTFISVDNFDLCPFLNITRLEIHKTNYDYEKANEKSRLNFTCETSSSLYEMKASKENCDHLKYIIEKYFVKRLKNEI